MKGNIKVEANMDRMGNITVRPVSDKWANRFAKRCKENGGHDDLTVFFQEGGAAAEFMDDLSPAQRKDLEHGWSVRFLCDPWIVGHWYGCDAHTVCEGRLS